jgi:hypothetical protein
MSERALSLAKFRIGRIVSTPNALQSLAPEDIVSGISKHMAGDWGDVDEDDRQANERALIRGARLWSVYEAGNCLRFWIITEADRSVTTILLPEDY